MGIGVRPPDQIPRYARDDDRLNWFIRFFSAATDRASSATCRALRLSMMPTETG